MTQDAVKGLGDNELVQVIAWAQGEQKTRAQKRKLDTIAKIKELARAAGVPVSIGGVRGRPTGKRNREQT